MINGCLFDTYPIKDKMISWIRDEKSIHRVEDNWTPSIFVASDDKSKLETLAKNKKLANYIRRAELVEKFEKVTNFTKSQVLELQLSDSSQTIHLGKMIESLEKFGTYRLYNVDVPPAQSYFYEHDIFPFGKCIKDKNWFLDDNIEATDYVLPDLRIVNVSVKLKKEGKLPKFTDKIESIRIDKAELESDNEADLILDFVDAINNVDPDFIITEGGDTFDFPYLISRAQENHVSERLILGRESMPLQRPRSEGTSYFSYGRIYFKPSAVKLYGRIHIDTASCFIWNDTNDLQGLYEIARLCRMPMQTASRASIGKCMSSLQFYNATKRDLLIPWKPTMAEAFKPRKELLIGDRGGLIFEPEVGVFENVLELDFASLYPSIMEKKNISAETIVCGCCPDSENRVPELDYNICKRRGIVPKSLEILLQKRKLYSSLLEKFPDNKIYDARKTALKWILVTSFGYLGFNNAKFGRIDAHIAVCAFARKVLSDAFKIAEDHGFQVLHGIVDSLWLYKYGLTVDDYEKVKAEIEIRTGFETSLEIYKWIVFLPSKEHKSVPVANRYFGARKDGKLKIRGIEARRHDTPWFFKRCQMEILRLFAKANSIEEVRKLLPEAQKIYKKYLELLYQQKVPVEELAFTTRTSKDADEYKVNTIQSDAILQLKEQGESVKAGQQIQYVISDYSRKRKRSIPLEMISDRYDSKRYAELLAECCSTVTKPFGLDFALE